MRPLLVLLGLAPTGAWAGELTFAPDRPGVGDSTMTPGAGRLMIEAGLAGQITQGAASVGTGGLYARYGVGEALEARLRLPDLGVSGGDLTVGPVGVGAKVGGAVSERWSVSLVPEVFLDLDGGSGKVVGGQLSANVALALGAFGVWAHGFAVGLEGPVEAFAGGGASVLVGEVGLFVNAGHTFGGSPLVGGGAWWQLSEGLQLDAAVDVLTADAPVIVPMAGMAIGL